MSRNPALLLLPKGEYNQLGMKPGSPKIKPDGSLAARPGDPYSVLRNRNLALYLAGRFASSMGQQMLTVAVGWELYDRTGSALSLGLVGLTQMVPMLVFTLPAGHMADNHDRKRIILLMTGAIACISAGLGVCSVLRAPVTWFYVCLFCLATARPFFGRPVRHSCRTWCPGSTSRGLSPGAAAAFSSPP